MCVPNCWATYSAALPPAPLTTETQILQLKIHQTLELKSHIKIEYMRCWIKLMVSLACLLGEGSEVFAIYLSDFSTYSAKQITTVKPLKGILPPARGDSPLRQFLGVKVDLKKHNFSGFNWISHRLSKWFYFWIWHNLCWKINAWKILKSTY